MVSLVVCLVVATSFVACSRAGPSAPDGLFFPTVPRQDAYPAALFSGQLVERSGCLVGGKGGPVLLWPDGYTARTAQDGRTQVLDENDAVIVTVGENVSLGGGNVGASFDTAATQQTPDACGHDYWLVAPS